MEYKALPGRTFPQRVHCKIRWIKPLSLWPFSFLLLLSFGIKAIAAQGLVMLHLAQHHLVLSFNDTVRMIGQVAAAHANGVHLGYIFRASEQGGHGSEWIAEVIL